MTVPVPLDRSPARLSSWIAVWTAVVAWSVTVHYSVHGMVVGAVGWVLVVIALSAGERAALTAGAGGLFVGVLVAAGVGAPPAAVLLGGTASVLVWDIGHNGISIGRQLGSGAPTARAELNHIVASVGVGIAIIGLASIGSRLVVDAQPIIAVVFLLLAAGLVAMALGPRDVVRFDLFE